MREIPLNVCTRILEALASTFEQYKGFQPISLVSSSRTTGWPNILRTEMATKQDLTGTQRQISDTINTYLDELRSTDPDDGKTYFISVMQVFGSCESAMTRHNSEMTPQFTEKLFEAGETALRICGERLLHLCCLPAPLGMLSRAAGFRPFDIVEPNLEEQNDDYDTGYKADGRYRLRLNANSLFAQPTHSDINGWRGTCALEILMLGGGSMKASKDLFAGEELSEEELIWRKELLDYTSLAVVGLAQSLSGWYGGRELRVWDQVICGSAAGEGV